MNIFCRLPAVKTGIFSRPAFECAVEIGQVAVTQFPGNLLNRMIRCLQQIDGFLFPDGGDERFIGGLFIGQTASKGSGRDVQMSG